MTTVGGSTETMHRFRHRWLIAFTAFGIPAVFMLSVAVVLLTAMSDQVGVSTRSELQSLDLGRPLAWVHQDQSAHDPPLPTHRGLASPWENPTSLSLDVFLMDVLVVFALIGVLVVVAALLVSAARRRTGKGPVATG